MENLQSQLFELITTRFSKKSDAVATIAKVLSIGKDSAYRRLRGNTPLTIDETSNLAKYFQISLDQLVFNKHDTVLFQFPPISKSINQFDDFLKFIYAELHDTASKPSPQIYYTSMEMPFFYYFLYPELAAFKLFVWGHTFWEFEYLKNQKFHFDVLPYTTQLLVKEVTNLYLSIESSNFFHTTITDNLLNQVEYFLSSGKFENPKDALVIYDKLSELCNHIKNMAAAGVKYKPDHHADSSTTPFHLYHNEMIHTTNTIVAKTDVSMAVFSSFDNPNYLKCTDEIILEHTKNWLNKLILKSTNISKSTERQRDSFFHSIEKRIAQSKQRIESLL